MKTIGLTFAVGIVVFSAFADFTSDSSFWVAAAGAVLGVALIGYLVTQRSTKSGGDSGKRDFAH